MHRYSCFFRWKLHIITITFLEYFIIFYWTVKVIITYFKWYRFSVPVFFHPLLKFWHRIVTVKIMLSISFNRLTDSRILFPKLIKRPVSSYSRKKTDTKSSNCSKLRIINRIPVTHTLTIYRILNINCFNFES